MGSIWPLASKEARKDGWRLDYAFLEAVKARMDEIDLEYSASLETIENCLIAAAAVEIDLKMTEG